MSSEPKIGINLSSILYNVTLIQTDTLYTLTVLFTVLDEAGNSRFNPGLNFPAANASCNCKENSKSNKTPYRYLLSKMRFPQLVYFIWLSWQYVLLLNSYKTYLPPHLSQHFLLMKKIHQNPL